MEPSGKFRGVYWRQSSGRRHNGKPDRCFYLTFKDGGKKVWEKVGWASDGYTAALATRLRSERIRAVQHGQELPGRKRHVTFGEVWEKYDEWLSGNRKRPRDDRSRYARHLKDRFESVNLRDLSPFDLERLKVDLAKEGLAPATVKHCLVLVRQVFNRAIAWGMWSGENPVRRVKLPAVSNRRERFLSPEEARTLIGELGKHGAQTRDAALLSLSTGMRAGEIWALRWGHVDLANSLLHVADPKGGEPRKVVLTREAAKVISGLERAGPEEYVFPARGGGRIPGVSKAYFDAVKRLGFNEGVTDRRQRVTFHTLRHTFGSWLALEGIPLRTIQDLMGHKTVQMTVRYSHLTPDHRMDAVEKVGKRLGKVEAMAKRGKKKVTDGSARG